MNDEIDEGTFEQVGRLLGTGRAAEMLDLLGVTLVGLGDLTDDGLRMPAGLAEVHRLKSEAGLMGFVRLSHACEAVDAAGARGHVAQGDLDGLRSATAAALRTIAALRQGRPRPTPTSHAPG